MADHVNLLKWDETGDRLYETGAKQCVLYPIDSNNTYSKGVAWNGITKVTEKPTGAEATDLFADDIKYLSLISAEQLEATIEAYMYPDEWGQCDGSAALTEGVMIGQQTRKMFGLCFRTTLGNDTIGNDYGYKLHLIYGCKASPSERGYETINDSPAAISFSWEIKTTPVAVKGFKPTSSITIDSTKVDATKLANLEAILYGTAAVEAVEADPEHNIAAVEAADAVQARLPLPDEVKTILGA